MKKELIKKAVKPSSFFVKTRFPSAIKKEQLKSLDIKQNLEHFTNEWLNGKLPDSEYKAIKNKLYKQQDKIINSHFVKTYSILLTESELRLFTEFQNNNKVKEALVNTGEKFGDIIFDSTERVVLDPIENTVNKIDSSKLGDINAIKKKTRMAKDITCSTKKLIKLRRSRKRRKA